MSRQRTWFQVFTGAQIVLVLALAGTALTWRNGISLLQRYEAGDASVTLQQLDDIDSTVRFLAWLTIVAIVVRLVTLIGRLHSFVRLTRCTPGASATGTARSGPVERSLSQRRKRSPRRRRRPRPMFLPRRSRRAPCRRLRESDPRGRAMRQRTSSDTSATRRGSERWRVVVG
jgi:hypothetical protein